MSNRAHWVTITYLLEGGTREDKSWICLSSIRIAEECQRASVREICITDEVPDYVGGKEPSLWIIGGQEFDDAEPLLLILPVRLEIVFVLRFQDRQITFFQSFGSKLAIHRRYTERRFLGIHYYYLQGITVRPVPCNYYVIHSVVALSRRWLRRKGSVPVADY